MTRCYAIFAIKKKKKIKEFNNNIIIQSDKKKKKKLETFEMHSGSRMTDDSILVKRFSSCHLAQ